MVQEVKTEDTKTKSSCYRIDVEFWEEGSNISKTRTTYMHVTGIPEDLPEEYEDTVLHAAEAQFAQALNQRLFLEFYTEGKTSRDEFPTFYNMTKISRLKIKAMIKIK